jgi:hypothetical protein
MTITGRTVVILGLARAVATDLAEEATRERCVQVSASIEVSHEPARPDLASHLTLTWLPDTVAVPDSYTVYRKPRGATAWDGGTVLAGSATSFLDKDVPDGSTCEYQIFKTNAVYGYSGYGYLYGGVNAPLVDDRGKVVLIVDRTYALELASELDQMAQDLVGDGWTVLRHDVARNDSVRNVKGLIKADYDSDPDKVKAVFLFGHVPVPYSGDFSSDFHTPAHHGAWPADVFYGDMKGVWTDDWVNDTRAESARNWNVPGDGKFDQSLIPAPVVLQVGRVDLSNLTAFNQSERELLRQYLIKDHRYRHKLLTAEARGLIHDEIGIGDGEAYAASGWRNFAPWFGPANITMVWTGDWFSTLASQSYLWAYGCGSGSYSSIAGLGHYGLDNEVTTWDFADSDPRAMFYMFLGSWLGDWDSENNIMRASLGTRTYGLACVIGGLPHWFGHHMALGESIGFSTCVTQNNRPTGLYRNQVDDYAGFVHVALMGDPTLRLHAVSPPFSLSGSATRGGIDLSWAASPEAVLGYHVYRANTAAGPFARLTSALVRGTNFRDANISPGTYAYMVRAVKLESTPSGTYSNASQGIFVTMRNFALSGDPMQITSVTKTSDGKIQLAWTSVPGRVYQVSATDGPINSGWKDLNEEISADAEITSWLDQTAGKNAQRFYRVRELR